MSDAVTIELTRDEALVLFEWLARRADGASAASPLSAEEIVLSGMFCGLEKSLAEILAPDYRQRLAVAQRAILGDAD